METVWALLKHRREEKLSDSLVLGLNRVKEQSAETWAKVGPVIKDQMGRYVKRDGKMVVRPDPAMEAMAEMGHRVPEERAAEAFAAHVLKVGNLPVLEDSRVAALRAGIKINRAEWDLIFNFVMR